DLSAVEYRVNGLETVDWRNPVLVPAAVCPHSGPELSGYRESRSEKTPHSAGELEEATKEAAFKAFWEKWPKKKAKARAWKTWKKIPIAEYTPLMAGLAKWLESEQWSRGIIPHPATWINEKRWQDEDIPTLGRANGTALASRDVLRQKRSTITDEG